MMLFSFVLHYFHYCYRCRKHYINVNVFDLILFQLTSLVRVMVTAHLKRHVLTVTASTHVMQLSRAD